MEVKLSIRKLCILLGVVWFFLLTAGLAVEVWKYVLYGDKSYEWLYFFGLSYEQNLPTWYSSSLLLLCAVQLALIALCASQQKASFRLHWWILSALFFYISLDEAVTLHEDLSNFFDFGGVLYFGWVIPASVFVTVVGIAYVPFLLHLPRNARWLFILAASLYVGGALGVELLLGYWTDLHGTKNLGYGLIDLVEESMEILGLSVYLVALLDYLANGSRVICIRVMN